MLLLGDQLLREYLRHECARAGDNNEVWEADSADAAIEAIRQHSPDLIVLDLDFFDGGSLRILEGAGPFAARTLVLSAFCHSGIVLYLTRLRIGGFIDRAHDSPASLREGMNAIRNGKTFFSPNFTAARMALLLDQRSYAKLLSDAEIAILGLVGRNLDDETIAAELKIAPRTVQTHCGHIKKKLRFNTRTEMAAFARSNGLHRLLTKQKPGS